MTDRDVYVSFDLIEAIKSFPARRKVEHCQSSFDVSPFDFDAPCPACGARVKVRSLAAVAEIEDVFDAVFEWLADPPARAVFEKRQREILRDRD